MTRLRYGTIAGIAGAAFALFNWWRHRPDFVARKMSQSPAADGLYQTSGTTRNPVGGAVV